MNEMNPSSLSDLPGPLRLLRRTIQFLAALLVFLLIMTRVSGL